MGLDRVPLVHEEGEDGVDVEEGDDGDLGVLPTDGVGEVVDGGLGSSGSGFFSELGVDDDAVQFPDSDVPRGDPWRRLGGAPATAMEALDLGKKNQREKGKRGRGREAAAEGKERD